LCRRSQYGATTHAGATPGMSSGASCGCAGFSHFPSLAPTCAGAPPWRRAICSPPRCSRPSALTRRPRHSPAGNGGRDGSELNLLDKYWSSVLQQCTSKTTGSMILMPTTLARLRHCFSEHAVAVCSTHGSPRSGCVPFAAHRQTSYTGVVNDAFCRQRCTSMPIACTHRSTVPALLS
jgi:hypothetical protein